MPRNRKERIARDQQTEVDIPCNTNYSAKIYNLSLNDYSSFVVNVDTLLRDRRSLDSWLDSFDKIVNNLVNNSEEYPRTVWFYSKVPSC